MATMPFIPNDPAAGVLPATFADQAEPDSGLFEILLRGYRRIGVKDGSGECAVTQRGAGANMSVDVAAGTAWISNKRVAVTAVNKAITAAHASLVRIDVVSVNASGTVTVTDGAANANPCLPALPSGEAVIAVVTVPANDTAITDSQIQDTRVRLDDDHNYATRVFSRMNFR